MTAVTNNNSRVNDTGERSLISTLYGSKMIKWHRDPIQRAKIFALIVIQLKKMSVRDCIQTTCDTLETLRRLQRKSQAMTPSS